MPCFNKEWTSKCVCSKAVSSMRQESITTSTSCVPNCVRQNVSTKRSTSRESAAKLPTCEKQNKPFSLYMSYWKKLCGNVTVEPVEPHFLPTARRSRTSLSTSFRPRFAETRTDEQQRWLPSLMRPKHKLWLFIVCGHFMSFSEKTQIKLKVLFGQQHKQKMIFLSNYFHDTV